MEITELRNVSAPTNMAAPGAQRRRQILTDPLVVPVHHIPFFSGFSSNFFINGKILVRLHEFSSLNNKRTRLSRVFVAALTSTDRKINSAMTGCFSPLTQYRPIFKNMPVDGTSK